MGKYVEEIYCPYGLDEARRRINRWKDGEGKGFKLLEKGSDYIKIKRKTATFILTYLPDHVKVEAWVGGITKYSISPNAFVGAIARRRGWKYFSSLKNALTEGVDSGALL